MTQEDYEKVARLVAFLKEETEANRLEWVSMPPIGLYCANLRGLSYTIDDPRDGPPEFIVMTTLAWRGEELRDLIRAIVAQNNRLHPRPDVCSSPDPSATRASEFLDKALATFEGVNSKLP